MTDVAPAPHAHPAGGGGFGGLEFNKKIGPLPAWGWGLIGGLVFGGWYYLHKRAQVAAAGNTPTADSLSPTSSSDGGDAGELGTTLGAAGLGGSTTGTTLAAWAANAVDWLIGQGTNPGDASNALSAYINGQTLTPAQETLVNEALTEFGAPPSGILPVLTGTTTPTTGTTTGGSTSTAPTAPTNASLSETQVRAASPNVRAIYNEYVHAVPGSTEQHELQTAYEGAVNDYRSGGEAHTPTLAAVMANIAAHTPKSAAAAAPVSTTKASPAARTYKVASGDTYTSIAQRFYGSASAANVAKVEAANSQYPARSLPVGATINIPT